MDKSGSDLLIDYIDELSRGRSRFNSAIATVTSQEVRGLLGSILTAVVIARVPPTVPQIGRSLGYPRQTVQRHVETLTEQGLIETVDNPDHKTARRLIATDAGKATYYRSDQASRAWAEQFAQQFDRGDLEVMLTTMRAIRQKLEAVVRDGGSPDEDDDLS